MRTPRPPTVERVVALNRGPFVAAPDPLEPARSLDGATVLDARPADVFAEGHAAGAINVPLTRNGFATHAAFVVSPEERIVLHALPGDEAAEAARRLRAVGFLELAGYVLEAPETETLAPVEVDELAQLVDADAVEVLDVRELYERDDGYIPGSRHIPYRLVREYGDELATGRPVVTICETGARAAVAASILAAAGIEARPVIHGGIPDWESRGGATVHFRRCGG